MVLQGWSAAAAAGPRLAAATLLCRHARHTHAIPPPACIPSSRPPLAPLAPPGRGRRVGGDAGDERGHAAARGAGGRRLRLLPAGGGGPGRLGVRAAHARALAAAAALTGLSALGALWTRRAAWTRSTRCSRPALCPAIAAQLGDAAPGTRPFPSMAPPFHTLVEPRPPVPSPVPPLPLFACLLAPLPMQFNEISSPSILRSHLKLFLPSLEASSA